jgi:hypothetical protein
MIRYNPIPNLSQRFILVLSLLLFLIFYGCEDKKKKTDPLVGTWELTESSGGTYLLVNQSQLAYFPWLPAQGDLRLSEFDNGAFLDSVTMEYFSVFQNEDFTNIHVDYRSPELEYNYNIQDYRPVLSQFDRSSLSKRVRNEIYPYAGGTFNYILTNNNRTVTINQDTLYREVAIDSDVIIDSSRMVVLAGTLSKQGEAITAGVPYLLDEQPGVIIRDGQEPLLITLVLNRDGTGKMTNRNPYGGSYTRDIEWVATDTTLIITECFELDCFDNGYHYTLIDNELSLTQQFRICGDFPDCYREQEQTLGLEPNTLEDLWTESVLVFKRR